MGSWTSLEFMDPRVSSLNGHSGNLQRRRFWRRENERSFSPSNRNAASLTAGTGGGGGARERGGRESRFRGTERKKRARARRRLNFLSRRRRSEDGSPLLIPRPSVWESPFLASHTLLNSLLLCFSPAISQTTRQLTTREKRSVSLPSASAIRGSFSRSGEFLQC